MSDGEIVPLVDETQTSPTTKEECLAACEEDDECVAAMPAYDYYCQLFKMSDVSLVDGFAENYQPQWECYAKPPSNMLCLIYSRLSSFGLFSMGRRRHFGADF